MAATASPERTPEDQSAAIASLLLRPELEMVPIPSADRELEFLPHGATVTVTASPSRGLDPTIELAAEVQRLGFRAVPHLAARSVRDRSHLTDLVDSLAAAGITAVFVVAGDAERAGDYPDGHSLLRALSELGYRPDEVGIPAYPDGHPFLSEDELFRVLTAKQPHASYMTTQMCFDPEAIRSWIVHARARGITLPVHLGLPGLVSVPKLLAVSARIGVGDSIRYLKRHTGLVRRLAGRFHPDELLTGLASVIADPDARVEALHFYTFNQLEATEAWRRAKLEELAGR